MHCPGKLSGLYPGNRIMLVLGCITREAVDQYPKKIFIVPSNSFRERARAGALSTNTQGKFRELALFWGHELDVYVLTFYTPPVLRRKNLITDGTKQWLKFIMGATITTLNISLGSVLSTYIYTYE